MATFNKFDDPQSANLIAYYNPGEPGTVTPVPGDGNEDQVAELAMAYGNHPDSPPLVGVDISLGLAIDGFGVGQADSVMSVSATGCELTSAVFTPAAVTGYSVVFMSELDVLPTVSGRYMGPSVYSADGLYSYVRSGSAESLDVRASTSGQSANLTPAEDTPFTVTYTVDVASNSAAVYFNGVLADDTMTAAAAMSSIARITMLNRWADTGLADTRPQPCRTALVAVYDAVLSTQDITDLHTLMLVWRDTGAGPAVNEPPNIVSNPVDQTVTAPEPAYFNAAASGTPTPTVAWQTSPTNADPWVPADDVTGGLKSTISGGIASNTLSLTSTVAEDNGKYVRMVASSDGNQDANSSGALLTINTTTYPTSTFFGPVLTVDPSATLKWQWSSTGTDPWYDVDDELNGLDSVGIDATETNVAVNGTIQDHNQLNINSATQANQTIYTRCKATTGYEQGGIFSSVNTLTIVEAT